MPDDLVDHKENPFTYITRLACIVILESDNEHVLFPCFCYLYSFFLIPLLES